MRKPSKKTIQKATAIANQLRGICATLWQERAAFQKLVDEATRIDTDLKGLSNDYHGRDLLSAFERANDMMLWALNTVVIQQAFTPRNNPIIDPTVLGD